MHLLLGGLSSGVFPLRQNLYVTESNPDVQENATLFGFYKVTGYSGATAKTDDGLLLVYNDARIKFSNSNGIIYKGKNAEWKTVSLT